MKWNATLKPNLQEQFPLYIFVSVLFLMGVIFGALLVNAMSLEQKQDMSRYLGSFFNTVTQGVETSYSATFIDALSAHVKWILLIWLLGLSVIGLPGIFILDFLKGVLIGFSIGYLVGQLSWKGVVFALASLAPQNLIIIPVLMMMSVFAISFSMFMIRNRFLNQRGNMKQAFTIYCVQSLAMVGMMLAVSLFETFVTPKLIEWVAPWLLEIV